MRKLTLDEIISRFKKIHLNKYDYSNVNYSGYVKRVEIVCKIHGKFLQTPSEHIRGSGCQKCARNVKYTLDEFICKSNETHKNFYDYSKVCYKNINSKVIIICKLHGEFKQEVYKHIYRKRGCPQCGKSKTKKRFSNEIFIKKSIYKHGHVYDYSKVEYIKNNKKVVIVCGEHGEFKQTPNSHLSGQGCPRCFYRISKPESSFLDFINVENKFRQIRIGKYNVDAVKNGIVYEFLGDYWHGNFEVYNPADINVRCKKSFGNLNIETFNKFKLLKKSGYEIFYIWENDWNKFKRGIDKEPKILTY